jgi:hypothetical protein
MQRVKGTQYAGMPAIDLLGEPNVTLGDETDALVYHGNVPDRAVPADLSELKSKYGAEMERRRKLTMDALALWQKRR